MSVLKDYHAYATHTGSKIKPILKIHFYANIIFRISHLLYALKLSPLSRLFWLFNRVVFSVDIDPRANLKGGFVILHGIGVVIGRYVIAEGSFKIYQGATLGGNNGKESVYNNLKITQPVIMNDVVIGINAVILGPVILNNGTRVGANSVVTKSVPENSIVIANNVILNRVSDN